MAPKLQQLFMRDRMGELYLGCARGCFHLDPVKDDSHRLTGNIAAENLRWPELADIVAPPS
jgi:hypothetical protein